MYGRSVLSCQETNEVNVTNSDFRNNTSNAFGSVIYLTDSSVILNNITMEDNAASSQTQGVYAMNSQMRVYSSTFKNSKSRLEADKLDQTSYYYLGTGGFFRLDTYSRLDVYDSNFEN